MLSPVKLIARQRQRDESVEVKWAAALIDGTGVFGRRITDNGAVPWIEVRTDQYNTKKLRMALGVGAIDTVRIGRLDVRRWRVEGPEATATIRLIYHYMGRQRLVAQLIDPSRPDPSLMKIRVVGWRQRARSFWAGLKKRFRRA